MNNIKEAILHYWRTHPQFAEEARATGVDIESGQLPVRGVMFDMDGVLFDSMPYHAVAWSKVCTEYGLAMTEEEVYMNEGRTGFSTINWLTMRQWGRETTQEEVEHIYQLKCDVFNQFPPAPKMPGAESVMEQIRHSGRTIMVVTGSGQASLLDRLTTNYPGFFSPELIVCSHDVNHGKPNPEPYLIGLKKLGAAINPDHSPLRPWEALVVENAPLGVRAGVAAGVFTIAANTGPLPESALLDEGANLLFPSMQAFSDAWGEMEKVISSHSTRS